MFRGSLLSRPDFATSGSGDHMREYLKRNWLNVLMAIIAALSGADAVAGIRAGKSPANVTVAPSILAALGTSGVLGARWINRRVVTSRKVRPGVPPEILDQLEDLFGVAESPDVTAEHAGHLADMAAAILLGHYRRAQQQLLSDRVKVHDQLTIPPESAQGQQLMDMLRSVIERDQNKIPPENPQQ